MLGGKAIVIAEFFTLLDVPFGNNPDRVFGDVDVTVGGTGMVDVAGFILEGLAVDIVPFSELEKIGIAFGESPHAFFLRNPRSDVLNNPRTFVDILGGEQSFACDARRANPDTNFHGMVVLPLDLCTARCLLRSQRRMMRFACVSDIFPGRANGNMLGTDTQSECMPIRLGG